MFWAYGYRNIFTLESHSTLINLLNLINYELRVQQLLPQYVYILLSYKTKNPFNALMH